MAVFAKHFLRSTLNSPAVGIPLRILWWWRGWIKLEWCLYQNVRKVWQYFHSFWHSTSIGQSDRQRGLVKQYRALRAPACWCTIKTLYTCHYCYALYLSLHGISIADMLASTCCFHDHLQWLCGRVPDLQSGVCMFESQPVLLCTKVYSAFHPSGVRKWVPAIAGKAKLWLIPIADERAGKSVLSLENTCHTWAILQWWFTTKRRYIKCMHLCL